MNQDEYYEREFASIAPSMPPHRGTQELRAREELGDVPYEKLIAYQERSAHLNLAMVDARIHRVTSVSTIFRAFSFLIRMSVLVGLGWSIFFWIH